MPVAPAARPANSWLICVAAGPTGPRSSASMHCSIRPRVSASGLSAITCVAAEAITSAGAASARWPAWDEVSPERSAGWMRSAPASVCTSRYCGNSASGETSLPDSRRRRKSSSANDERSMAVTAAPSSWRTFCMSRTTACSLARSTRAPSTWPTMSSAPALWWKNARACCMAAEAVPSISVPRGADSVSRSWRRSALCALSRVRRSSSATQASVLRSAGTACATCSLNFISSAHTPRGICARGASTLQRKKNTGSEDHIRANPCSPSEGSDGRSEGASI